MIASLLDRFLSWLSEPRWRNVAQADRFAREQAQLGCVAPGTEVEIEHTPIVFSGSLKSTEIARCSPEACTITEYHVPCAYQTALAAQRDAKREGK